jgi:hypothetical protein
MNGAFAQEQLRNYTRMTMLESTFDTTLFKRLNQMGLNTLCAPQFYETKNALAIHKGYWTSVARAKGLDLDVKSECVGETPAAQVLSDQQVALLLPGRVTLLSLARVEGRKLAIFDESHSLSDIVSLGQGVRDSGFYVYAVGSTGSISQGRPSSMHAVLDDGADTLFAVGQGSGIGNTLATAQVISGIYKDGWAGREASVRIRTGKTGKLSMSGSIRVPLTDAMAIEVFSERVSAGVFRIASKDFNIVVPVNGGDKIAEVTFAANWDFQPLKPDVRRLSYVLVDLHGE